MCIRDSLHIAIEEGVAANVDSLLCIIGEENEDISSFISVPVVSSSENSQLDLVDQINEQEKSDDVQENIDIKPVEEISPQISSNVEYIKMPRLSDTMEEGTISSWLKKEGDEVSEGDILAEIETDKATMEFESFYEGKLVYIGVKEGQTVKVDDLIAIISDGEVDVDKLLSNFGKEENIESNNDFVKEDVSKDEIESPSIESEPEESIVLASNDLNKRIIASPLAKKIASEKNIDLSKIQGSGDNGRIIKSDLDNIESSQSITNQPVADDIKEEKFVTPVSYTHLTLPTKA